MALGKILETGGVSFVRVGVGDNADGEMFGLTKGGRDKLLVPEMEVVEGASQDGGLVFIRHTESYFSLSGVSWFLSNYYISFTPL